MTPPTGPPDPADRGEDLTLLVEDVQDYAILLLGPTGDIRSWNRGAAGIMGYETQDAIGQHFSILYLPEDLAARKPQHELEVAAREGRIEDEGWRVRKDGTRFWASTIITALRDKVDGELRGFSKVTRDLTARRSAIEKLRQSEEQFRLLVESVKDYAIFMLDPGGHVMSWNAGARRIKQYAPEEILGKHFSIFYPPEDIRAQKPEHELETAIREGRVEDEGWRLRKDGSRFWANVVITAVFDSNHELRGFAKVTRDVTSRKEADETRRALLEQREARLLAEEDKQRAEASYRAAQEANRAKDAFLMTLSHELRTPMTAILGWSRMLPTMSTSDPVFREAIAAIGRSAKVQAQLIEDVLDVSRMVSGKLRLNVESIDLRPVLEASLDGVRPTANAKEITLAADVPPNIGSISADTTRLQQIIWNLLSNAVKFTPRRGRVELSAHRTGSRVEIAVTDNGEGIDPEFLPHVFEAFRQAETPSTRVHGGLGLGLSIVRYLAEAHGGEVTAESLGRGKGARFSITLPIRAVREVELHATAAHDQRESPPEMASLSGYRILVVDDDNESRDLIAAALRYAGATVTAVESAAKALAHTASHHQDIVLTDIAMPHTDGYSLQRSLRERGDLANTRIVALTAFPATVVSADEKQFDRYLRKPIDPFELAATLRELIGTA
jgi:PAS domain S-box-containing protein